MSTTDYAALSAAAEAEIAKQYPTFSIERSRATEAARRAQRDTLRAQQEINYFKALQAVTEDMRDAARNSGARSTFERRITDCRTYVTGAEIGRLYAAA